MPGARLSLIEFPADDPERARRFWEGLLDDRLEERVQRQGSGCQTRGAGPAIGIHAQQLDGRGGMLGRVQIERGDRRVAEAAALMHVTTTERWLRRVLARSRVVD